MKKVPAKVTMKPFLKKGTNQPAFAPCADRAFAPCASARTQGTNYVTLYVTKINRIILYTAAVLLIHSASYGIVTLPTSYFPPAIKDLSTFPQEPKVGQEIKVTAVLESREEKVEEAYVFFSTDNGNTWNKADMEQSVDNKTLWMVTIPAQKQEKKVIFYIMCLDSAGNVSTEIPGPVRFQEQQDKNIPAWLPVDNSMALFYADENDDERDAPDDYDVLSLYGGIDDKYLYLKFTFEGNVPAEPVTAQEQVPYYEINIANADHEDIHDHIQGDNYLYYAPTAPAFYIGLPMCGMAAYDASDRIRFSDWKPQDFFVDKNVLFMRIARQEIQRNPQTRVKLFIRSGYQNELPNIYKIAPLDITGFIYIYFTTHSVEVKAS